MATRNCGSCGARFEGEGAADALATHIEDFHPPSPFTGTAKTAKAVAGGGPAVDGEARSAIGRLGELVNAIGDRVTDLEAAARESEAANEGGDGKPADEPEPSSPGEAGTPPGA
jgi:hypothetical protein